MTGPDDIHVRRARVFERIHAERRRKSREARERLAEMLAGRMPSAPLSRRHRIASTLAGTLGTALVLRGSPLLAERLSWPPPLAFALLGALLGIVFGAFRDADGVEERVEHAAAAGAMFGIAFGVLSALVG